MGLQTKITLGLNKSNIMSLKLKQIDFTIEEEKIHQKPNIIILSKQKKQINDTIALF